MEPTHDLNTLHRTAKYFMDDGRAGSPEEAMNILRDFGLSIYVGAETATSVHHQACLLTLVNCAHRTLLGGIDVFDVPECPSITPLAQRGSLKEAVLALGGRIGLSPNSTWPAALIGDAQPLVLPKTSWRLTWNGWRGGVTPSHSGLRLREGERSSSLSPLVAAAACAGEAFAYHAKDHVLAGNRDLGLSLWNPGADWLSDDPSEAAIVYLPSELWLIGLGNLGQAYAWALASLPYRDREEVVLVLNDFDKIMVSNESTSLLSFSKDIGRRKARVVSDWMETRGFTTFLEERHFGASIKRSADEPNVALCGVDNALVRTHLEKAGFGLVVEAGLGAGPESFRSFSLHTFPASRSAETLWSRMGGQTPSSNEQMPAYRELKRRGMDRCGLTRLANRTVAVPFVGLTAACLTISELLRRLNGGQAFEVISGSTMSLSDIEGIPMATEPYAHGHLAAA
jgi:hypothetical protein